MKRFLAVALGLIVGFGFSVSFQKQAFGTLPSTLNDRFFNLFGDAGSGATYVRVEAVTDAGGTLPSTLNDRWYNAFADAGSGLTALKVVCTGCGGGTATSVTLADTAVGFGDASNLLTGDATNFNYTTASKVLAINDTGQYRTTVQPSLVQMYETDGFGPALRFYEAGGGTYTSPTVSSSGDQIASISFLGTSSTPAFIGAATIQAFVDATPGSFVPGRLSLLTAPSSGTATEAVRIDSFQRVSAASSVTVGSLATLNVNTGQIALAKAATTTVAPGASGAKIGVLCGTNSGTLKMVMYAGTSTTAVTIVDNVGSGVTGC